MDPGNLLAKNGNLVLLYKEKVRDLVVKAKSENKVDAILEHSSGKQGAFPEEG